MTFSGRGAVTEVSEEVILDEVTSLVIVLLDWLFWACVVVSLDKTLLSLLTDAVSFDDTISLLVIPISLKALV